MSVDTKAVIRGNVTLDQICNAQQQRYNAYVEAYNTGNEHYFRITLNLNNSIRIISVFYGDFAKNNHNIPGILLSLGCNDEAVEILTYLCEVFGGYLDENDCDNLGFIPINETEFQKSGELTKEEKFKLKIAHSLGYENIGTFMSLLDDYLKDNS
jgi:hypothetical protein